MGASRLNFSLRSNSPAIDRGGYPKIKLIGNTVDDWNGVYEVAIGDRSGDCSAPQVGDQLSLAVRGSRAVSGAPPTEFAQPYLARERWTVTALGLCP